LSPSMPPAPPRLPPLPYTRSSDLAVDVIEVEPEEQHVAAEQRAEQRPHGVPAVERAGDGAEVALAVAQLVEEQRERRAREHDGRDRKSTRLNSSHVKISYAGFCLK